jgi:hypothetical protein
MSGNVNVGLGFTPFESGNLWWLERYHRTRIREALQIDQRTWRTSGTLSLG